MHVLSESVYFTNTLNPSMWVFDVVMRTEYGTSHNSHVLASTENTAFIDANHATFTDEWLVRVETVLHGHKPDHLVFKHTEPNHSGSAAACRELYPDIMLVYSAATAINIKNITNMPDVASLVVKNGETIDLANMTCHYILAPFLHWHNTMFIWVPERNNAFICDFLGALFCKPRLIDNRTICKKEYITIIRQYYNATMALFTPWVQKVMDAEIVATSYGPILTRGSELECCEKKYREWSAAPLKDSPLCIELFFCSAFGNTAKLADFIARGVRKALPSADVTAHDLVRAVLNVLVAELNAADTILIGSPAINRNGLSLVWNLLAVFDALSLAKRPVALFGSCGWSGEALPLCWYIFLYLKPLFMRSSVVLSSYLQKRILQRWNNLVWSLLRASAREERGDIVYSPSCLYPRETQK